MECHFFTQLHGQGQQQQHQHQQEEQQRPPLSSSAGGISRMLSSAATSTPANSGLSSPPTLTTTTAPTLSIKVTRACGTCSALKMRCSGETPCVRCWRFCLKCVPRVPSAPRPRGSTNTGSSSAILKAAKNPQSGRSRQPHRKKKTATMEPSHHLDLLSDLRLRGQDPRVYANLYLQVFRKMYNQGKVARGKVLNALRVWQMLSLVAEIDVTWGAAARIAEMMQITPIELEGPQMLGLELTPKHRQTQARAAFVEVQRQCNDFKQTARFREACKRHGGGVLMMNVDGDKALRACNEAYDQLFISAADPYVDMVRHKMLLAFMQASAVCPEDRDIMLQLCIEMLFACDVLPSQVLFLKAFGHDGKIRLLMVKVQRSRHGNEDQTTLHIEEAPPSRHLTPTPHAPGVITRTFRHTTFNERVAVSHSLDADGGGRPGAGAGGAAAARAPLMCTAFPFAPPPKAIESYEGEARAADIFVLPQPKERKQAASGLCLLAAVASLNDIAGR